MISKVHDYLLTSRVNISHHLNLARSLYIVRLIYTQGVYPKNRPALNRLVQFPKMSQCAFEIDCDRELYVGETNRSSPVLGTPHIR